jgi:hypothetical protein
MYRAFKLSASTFDFGSHRWTEQRLMETQVSEAFDSFLRADEINGTLLRDRWFPNLPADVFISHSHADEEIAVSLAGWLNANFGIDSFIDSCVWGHSNELLKKIDDKHCKNDGENTYSYERRNGSTSHVHMMLATAISRMIDRCECVIFVSTPQSVSTSENLETAVSSPWIFYELSQMEVIRKWRPLREITKKATLENTENFSRASAPAKFKYTVDFSSLSTLGNFQLEEWLTYNQLAPFSSWHPLDVLYDKVLPAKRDSNGRTLIYE